MEPITILLLGIVSGFAGYFITVGFYRLANSSFTYEETLVALWKEVRQSILLEVGVNRIDLMDIRIAEIRDAWMNLKFISLEDRILLVRAGYAPKEARKALRKFSREELKAQAYLRGWSTA